MKPVYYKTSTGYIWSGIAQNQQGAMVQLPAGTYPVQIGEADLYKLGAIVGTQPSAQSMVNVSNTGGGSSIAQTTMPGFAVQGNTASSYQIIVDCSDPAITTVQKFLLGDGCGTIAKKQGIGGLNTNVVISGTANADSINNIQNIVKRETLRPTNLVVQADPSYFTAGGQITMDKIRPDYQGIDTPVLSFSQNQSQGDYKDNIRTWTMQYNGNGINAVLGGFNAFEIWIPAGKVVTLTFQLPEVSQARDLQGYQ